MSRAKVAGLSEHKMDETGVHPKGNERSRETRKSTTHKQGRQRSSVRDDSLQPLRSGSHITCEQPTRQRCQPNRSSSRDMYRSRSSSYEQRRRHSSSRGVDGRRRRRDRGSRDRSRRSKSRSEHQIPPLPDHVSTPNIFNSETQAFFATLVEALTSSRPQSNKFPILGNVIPEFDPMAKSQTIAMWVNKVEECARLYGWGDDQIIHYALPKLSGIAISWYQALPSMSYSWSEWIVKLEQSFPSSENYAELLIEMLSKRVKFNDSLEYYYYEKINLLNRCEIYGKRAVVCLLYGIEDRSLRLGAKAAKCQEPEQVPRYFLSIKQQPRESDRLKYNYDKRINTTSSLSSNNVRQTANGSETKTLKLHNNASIVWFNCNEPGHYSSKCTKKTLKCNICSKLGHLSVNCPRLPPDPASKINELKEKVVMSIETNNLKDNKYLMDLKLNGEFIRGYMDLGSQCTLIRHSEAVARGITWTDNNLPTMREIGENIVVPLGSANAPSIFQRAMNKILSKVNYTIVFMDDVLIPSRSYDQGMIRLEEVLQLMKDAGLTLKLNKCSFFCSELEFLGLHVSGEGIRPGIRKTLAIENFPVPRNVHDVRQFIGLTSFFRRFVKNFALIARPLTDLLKSKFAWKWTAVEAESFKILKAKLVECPILALYDRQLETEIHTDASKLGIAGILFQRSLHGVLRPVAYYSRKTSVDEQKFHSFELETLAVVAS